MKLIGTIRTKGNLTGRITYNENEYREGFIDGKIEGQSSIEKFAVQNEVQGNGMIVCDYVNEEEHKVELQVSKGNAEVKVCGKNLWDKANSDISKWRVYDSEYYYGFPIFVGKGNTFTAKYHKVLPSGLNMFVCITLDGKYESSQKTWFYHSTTTVYQNQAVTLTANEDYIYLWCLKDSLELNIFKDKIGDYLQIELGTQATDYEEYKGKTYTSNSDGTVNGVTSVSPIMNIICEGVDISAKYYQIPSADYNRMWDSFQKNGMRDEYSHIFRGAGWNDTTFIPKYSMMPITTSWMFAGVEISDLSKILEECGVTLDASNATYVDNMFNASKVTKVPYLNLSKGYSNNAVFNGCQYLEEIEGISFAQRGNYTNMFGTCIALRKINVFGIISLSVNFQWSSLLEVESAKNILRCLANLIDTNPFANTVTFHANVWAKLDAEGETSPIGTTWKNYITEIGWNWN